MKLIRLVFVAAIMVVALAVGYQYLPFNNPGPTPTSSSSEAFKVTFLDVGQADCTLIQTGGKAMLIDAGNNNDATTIINNLSSLGVQKLDVVIGTHPHEDHIGGMDTIINKFDIGQIYLPKVTATTKTFTDMIEAIKANGLTVTTPVPGTTSNLGDAQWTILAPNSATYSETNNYSIVIRMFYGSTSFLFTGDAQVESEKEMLDKGYTLKSNILKVGHHGSSSSTSLEFLQAVFPEYAVIFVGKDNDYGHPHQETLDKLNASGIKTYRTDLNGNITFNSDGQNLSVRTEK
jgi:competence protein ComEC